jgi:hypothetical protein
VEPILRAEIAVRIDHPLEGFDVFRRAVILGVIPEPLKLIMFGMFGALLCPLRAGRLAGLMIDLLAALLARATVVLRRPYSSAPFQRRRSACFIREVIFRASEILRAGA